MDEHSLHKNQSPTCHKCGSSMLIKTMDIESKWGKDFSRIHPNVQVYVCDAGCDGVLIDAKTAQDIQDKTIAIYNESKNKNKGGIYYG